MSGYAVVCTFVYLVIRRMFQKFSEHTFQALESLDPTFPAVHQRQQEMLAGLPSAFGTRWLAVLQRGWHNSIGLYSVVWECMRRSKVESCSSGWWFQICSLLFVFKNIFVVLIPNDLLRFSYQMDWTWLKMIETSNEVVYFANSLTVPKGAARCCRTGLWWRWYPTWSCWRLHNDKRHAS